MMGSYKNNNNDNNDDGKHILNLGINNGNHDVSSSSNSSLEKKTKKKTVLTARMFKILIVLMFLHGLYSWYWMVHIPFTMKSLNKQLSSFLDDYEISILKSTNDQSLGTSISSSQGNNREGQRPRVQLDNYFFDKSHIIINENSGTRDLIRTKVLSAHVEAPMKDEIEGTGSFGNDNKGNVGIPSEFIVPLPLRTTSPDQLQTFQYPRLKSCHDMPAKLPVDAGLLFDENGEFVYSNTGRKAADPNDSKHSLQELAKYCPVDIDPFLPWIHDVFPSHDGSMIHFIAQNKRRCNTGKMFASELNRLRPQVALMQPVSVKRIPPSEALKLAPNLWSADNEYISNDNNNGLPRYQLAPYEEADTDAQQTRFICRFHALHIGKDVNNKQTLQDVIVGETLSTYQINYELVNSRKGTSSMITPKGNDNHSFWLSNFKFNCPVPDNGILQQIIASGNSILDDGTPTVYVDVIPIRTSPRFGNFEGYFDEERAGPKNKWPTTSYRWKKPLDSTHSGFDAKTRWGDKHVLPMIEASGRWKNVPICKPPQPTNEKIASNSSSDKNNEIIKSEKKESALNSNNNDKPEKKEKPHDLVACVWASKTFATRGGTNSVSDTSKRILEWLEFHLLVGFDHIYIYDNTGANTNETSLEEITSLFSDSEITRIDWPSRVCNNNKPASPSPGERSSQYAAENSCLQRYGQYTEWMASFDTDEYLIPMGDNKNLKDMLAKVAKNTKILSFKSTRAYADINFTQPYFDHGFCGSADNPLCVEKKHDALFVETYNCDFIPLPKPDWADRARKQIYRTDYVLTHFVHYSTITRGHAMTYKEAQEKKLPWKFQYSDRYPTERFTKEDSEAVMLHSKTTPPGDTKNWKKFCKSGAKLAHNQKCRVGFPILNNKPKKGSANANGYEYNCYTNIKLTNEFIPKLKIAMQNRLLREKENPII